MLHRERALFRLRVALQGAAAELFKLGISGQTLQRFVPAAFLPIGRGKAYAVHGQRGAQTNVRHGRAHADLIAACGNLPAVAPDGKAAVVQFKAYRLALAGLQADLSKAL